MPENFWDNVIPLEEFFCRMSSGITLKPYEYVIVIEVLGGAAFVHSIPILGRRVKEDCYPNEIRRRGSDSHI